MSLNNIANSLFEQAKQDDLNGPQVRRGRGARVFNEASETETLYRRGLAIQEKTLGENHPSTAAALTGDLGGEDGLLSMKEVNEDLELSAELVVLSACNTAGDSASSSNGEGFAGLTRSFSRAHPFFWAPFVVVGD